MSLTIGVRFLTGYYVAARSKTDPRPEWPPHPARLFLALAAAHFECEGGDAGRAALTWLESLPPPVLHLGEHAAENEAVPTFVPLNDRKSMGKGGTIQTLPQLKRHRNDRLFPRTQLPEVEDRIFFVWDAADGQVQEHCAGLEWLCRHVSRLGHSMSLVQVWLAEGAEAGLEVRSPATVGGEKLRVVSESSGTLERLEQAYRTPPRHRFEVRDARSYAKLAATPPGAATSVWSDALDVLALRPERAGVKWLASETTLALTQTLRAAILDRCPAPIPSSISGHRDDGGPAEQPHVTLLPLPFVGHAHADGHLLGVAVAWPQAMPDNELSQLIEALDAIADEGAQRGTGLGFDGRRYPGLGQWRLVRRGVLDDLRRGLRVDTWTASGQGCRAWASVTPVVFDRHGKARSKSAYLEECEADVLAAAGRVVADAAVEQVRVTPVSAVLGAPPAHAFPRLRRKDGSQRRHLHVVVRFNRPVVGPVVLGAGRFRGYGLLRPLAEGEGR